MSANDRILLDALLEQQNLTTAPQSSADEYFEFFVADQVLKDYDLSADEISEGIVDGGGDGGLDAIYIFVNGQLLAEDDEVSSIRREASIHLICIQAKNTGGFGEDSLDKMRSSAEALFNLAIPLDSLKNVYNEALLKIVSSFRAAYQALASKLPSISIAYFYATKGAEVHPNVSRRVSNLEDAIKKLFSDVKFSFKFLNDKDLVSLARLKPKTSRALVTFVQPMQSKGAFVCLVKLRDLFEFITDEGKLARHIFDSNVRDHQGRTEVNVEIQATLESDPNSGEEFWWLNNGVTILGKSARYDGTKVLIEDPQIVNGVQTSTEIFNHYKSDKIREKDERSILVRIVDPPSDASEDRIIRATNSQNAVAAASLRSTDKIHRDIEQYFRPHGYFYDRRKNFYRNDGKPLAKIIGIPYLSQALMAITLRKPDSARARPSSLLKNDEQYARLFSEQNPLGLYLKCALLMRRVDEFMNSSVDITKKDITNLRFYVAMLAAMTLTGMPQPKPIKIAEIDVNLISDQDLTETLHEVKGLYLQLGGSDQIAKGPELTKALITFRTEQYVAKKKTKVIAAAATKGRSRKQ